LTSTIADHPSTSRSDIGPILLMPALLTRTSRRPNSSNRGADEPLEILAARDVSRADDGLSSSIAQFGGDALEAAHPPGTEDHSRATLAEHPRCRFSDTAAGTGDGDDFSGDA